MPMSFAFWKVPYVNLEFQFSIVSVAEQTGLKLALSETPKTIFVASNIVQFYLHTQHFASSGI